MKKHAIVTASDAKYGDFLIDHWFRSLRENVNLAEIQPVILDYGLSTAQRFYLNEHGAVLAPYPKDGHVVVIRFTHLADFLKENQYDQVILSDGGDIIFQDDFSSILNDHPELFRGVREDLRSGFGIFITDEFFNREDKHRLRETLMDEEMVNAGFIVGPREKMMKLGHAVEEMIKTKTKFGPDQLVVNYLFLKEGFHPLDRRYNFVIATAQAKIEIREGLFYADGELIPVVHNTGNFSFLRPVERFGYGPGRNQLKRDLLKALHTLHSTTDSFYETRSALKNRVKHLTEELSKGAEQSQDQLQESWDDFRKLFFGDEE